MHILYRSSRALCVFTEVEYLPWGSSQREDVTAANGSGQRWYQLYWPSNAHNEYTASMLKRAQDSGYDVLVVNVDTFIVGWRPTDLDHGYSPFLRADHVGVEIGLTDPVYRKNFKEKYGKEVEEDLGTAAAGWLKTFVPGYPHGWEDFAFLKQHWKGPIVVKGIQTVADAEKCVELGLDGIVVSNHGGRQVDGGVGSLDFLPEIVDAVGDKLVVMFDSGNRSGVDNIKALALGAKMCFIGRPWVYGLHALQGEAGVSHVLKALLGEMDISLHLTGIKSVEKDLIGNRK